MMKKCCYRTIAWLCLIAQLNLIPPQFHEARAMEVEEEHITSVPSKTLR